MCQENLNNKEKRQELWKKLEEATQNFHKEIYGLQCIVEGVIEEKKSNDKKGLSKQWIDDLDKFRLALSGINLNLTMNSMEFWLPSYFLTYTKSSTIGIYEYDTASTIILLKKIRRAVIAIEGGSLPGDNTAYQSHGLASQFLRALSDFEDCFLDYVNC